MLIGSSTKYGAGLTLAGDTNDFADFRETIQYFASENGAIPPHHSEFVLGLVYELRHANQGDRRIEVFGSLDNTARYNAFDSLWPIFLVQLATLRAAAAYVPNEKSHQANLYRIESCVQSALEAVDAKAARECMRWLSQFSPLGGDFLIDFVSYLSQIYVSNETTAKRRIRSLPEILNRISAYSPEYQAYEKHIKTIAVKQNCRPEDLFDHSDSPDFKW